MKECKILNKYNYTIFETIQKSSFEIFLIKLFNLVEYTITNTTTPTHDAFKKWVMWSQTHPFC